MSLGDGEEVSTQGPRPGLLQPLQLNWGHCASNEPLLVGLSEWVRLQELVPWIISREQPLLAALFGESWGISGAAPTPPPSRQLLALSSLKVAKASAL